MTQTNRCQKTVYRDITDLTGRQCARPSVDGHMGFKYCFQHSPDRIAERQADKSRSRLEAYAQVRRTMVVNSNAEALLAAVEGLIASYCGEGGEIVKLVNETTSEKTLARWRNLQVLVNRSRGK